ncbi:MAG: HU family DNA-binding protein [Deltaproteobacteria bacterium]|nr:HU family DNA-binding protein [Deltaproteobacteria bacterium]
MTRFDVKDFTRSDILNSICARLSLSRKDAKSILENFLEIVTKGLENSETIVLNGVGTFRALHTPARPGRNPRTGRLAKVPARTRVSFKISPRLRAAMDDRPPSQGDFPDDLAEGAKPEHGDYTPLGPNESGESQAGPGQTRPGEARPRESGEVKSDQAESPAGDFGEGE